MTAAISSGAVGSKSRSSVRFGVPDHEKAVFSAVCKSNLKVSATLLRDAPISSGQPRAHASQMNRVVLSLHGIKTRGVWQKALAPVLARHRFIPHPLDYGNFLAVELMVPYIRNRKIEWLRGEFERIYAEENIKRVSIIAHSLGTLIVAGLLDKYAEIKVDKVIFAGSIVKEDFDWAKLFDRGQINLLENDTGGSDWWPKIAKALVPGAGAAGVSGFSQSHSHGLMIGREFAKHAHSDYFHRNHFTTYWIPTLNKNVINENDRKPLLELMNLAVVRVASQLELDKKLVRANIFMQDEPDRLTIPLGLHYNMGDPNELAISIPLGAGCSGKAFKERKQAIAILKQGWGVHELPDAEAAKVNPELRWIIATPIPDPEDKWGVLGIFAVDGIVERRELDALGVLSEDLTRTAQLLSSAYRGVQ